MQERAIEEVKLAIKPFYQRRDINKDEYKEILRKAVHKVGSAFAEIDESLTKSKSTTNKWAEWLLPEKLVFVLCSWSSGVSQQEWRDQSSEGGHSGQGICGQIQTCSETQKRRRFREAPRGTDWDHANFRQPMRGRDLQARIAAPIRTYIHVRLVYFVSYFTNGSLRPAHSFQMERVLQYSYFYHILCSFEDKCFYRPQHRLVSCAWTVTAKDWSLCVVGNLTARLEVVP